MSARSIIKLAGTRLIHLGSAVFLGASVPWNEAVAEAPTVIELFQSQGCSSCPPANANIIALADRPDLLVLSFEVTYWDRLGWADTFGSPDYTRRQRDYSRGAFHREYVSTPQVIINGRVDLVGSNRVELDRAIAQTPRSASGPTLSISKSLLTVGASPAPQTGADVWLVRYDPRVVHVAIKAGENRGRTLPHRNVVRQLTRLGSWSGAARTFNLPSVLDPAYRTAILVQATNGGPIISALKAS